ncbi:hypothetical protein HDU87_008451 [Geranomyces variabilis]|uniref:Uncharacterized protein n=1 Tax=Geranomyces variabilis TaxID=109894 RepID=A0AAD5XM35_9FUNG|nr:hypothetical protein HDU87_008451 [Geranomyces variabilis]
MPLDFSAVHPPPTCEPSAYGGSSPRSDSVRRSKSARFATAPNSTAEVAFPDSPRCQRRDSSSGSSGAEINASAGFCEELVQSEIGLSGSKFNICRRPPTAPALARRSSVDAPPKKTRKDQPPPRLRREASGLAAAALSAEARTVLPATESSSSPLRKIPTLADATPVSTSTTTTTAAATTRGPSTVGAYEDDGPASLSEVVRTKLQQHVRPTIAQHDTFFDDISGWGEEDSLAVGSGGATYQYLSFDAGDGDPPNTSQSPGPDVVQRLKRIYIRKRHGRSAKTHGNKSTALTIEQKKSKRRGRVGYGEDEDHAGVDYNGEETEEASGAIVNVLPERDETTTLIPSGNIAPRSAALNPSSIPSKPRGVKSAALEHVSISAGALMVPRVPDKRRPQTGKPLSVSHRIKTPSAPDLSSPATGTDTMAQMRKKLLSSARTNNRNLGILQNSSEELRGPGGSPSALGSAIVTGTKYCSQTLTARVDSIGSVLSAHEKKPSGRHWTSSNSISEPLTLPAPPAPSMLSLHLPQPSSALLALESSLTLLPIIATGKQSSRSLIASETSLPGRPGSSLPHAALSPLQAQQYSPQLRSAMAQGQLNADSTQSDRQLHSTNPVIRRPVKKLSQNGFQAVAFWDEEPVDCAPPDLRGPVSADSAIDSLSLPTPLGARSFRDSIFLNRCRGVGT